MNQRRGRGRVCYVYCQHRSRFSPPTQVQDVLTYNQAGSPLNTTAHQRLGGAPDVIGYVLSKQEETPEVGTTGCHSGAKARLCVGQQVKPPL